MEASDLLCIRYGADGEKGSPEILFVVPRVPPSASSREPFVVHAGAYWLPLSLAATTAPRLLGGHATEPMTRERSRPTGLRSDVTEAGWKARDKTPPSLGERHDRRDCCGSRTDPKIGKEMRNMEKRTSMHSKLPVPLICAITLIPALASLAATT